MKRKGFIINAIVVLAFIWVAIIVAERVMWVNTGYAPELPRVSGWLTRQDIPDIGTRCAFLEPTDQVEFKRIAAQRIGYRCPRDGWIGMWPLYETFESETIPPALEKMF